MYGPMMQHYQAAVTPSFGCSQPEKLLQVSSLAGHSPGSLALAWKLPNSPAAQETCVQEHVQMWRYVKLRRLGKGLSSVAYGTVCKWTITPFP